MKFYSQTCADKLCNVIMNSLDKLKTSCLDPQMKTNGKSLAFVARIDKTENSAQILSIINDADGSPNQISFTSK